MNRTQKVFDFFKKLYELGLYVFGERDKIENIKVRTQNELKKMTDMFKEMESITLKISDISNKVEGELSKIYNKLPSYLTFYNKEIERIEKVLKFFEKLSQNTEKLLEEIHHIEIVSRNSEIKAYHLGEKGKGLSVVSQELSKLAQRIISHAKILSLDVEKIKDNFESLKFKQNKTLELVGELNKYEKILSEIFEKLKDSIQSFLNALKDLVFIYSERKSLLDELFKNIIDLETKSTIFFNDAEKVLIYSEIFKGNEEILESLYEIMDLASSSPFYLRKRLKSKIGFFSNNIDLIIKELSSKFSNFEKSKEEWEKKLDILKSTVGKIKIQDKRIKDLENLTLKNFKLNVSYYLDQINNMDKIINEFFSYLISYQESFNLEKVDFKFLKFLKQMKEDLKDGEILSLYSSVETARAGIKEDPLSLELKERVRNSISLSDDIIGFMKEISNLSVAEESLFADSGKNISFFDTKKEIELLEESFDKIGEMTDSIGRDIEKFKETFETLEEFINQLSLRFKDIERLMSDAKRNISDVKEDTIRRLPHVDEREEKSLEEIVLRLPLTSNPANLDPYMATDATSNTILENIHRSLFMVSSISSKVIPFLVEKFEIEKEGKLYIFYIRKNVKFHNGDLLTSHDVRDSLMRTLKGNYRNYFDMIKGSRDFIEGKKNFVDGIRIVDDYRIEIELEYPFVPFIYNLALTGAAITKEIGGNLIGLGPFILKDYKKDKYVELVAFEDYFAGRSNVDRIIFLIRETGTKEFVHMFLKGEIDLLEPSFDDEEILSEKAPNYLNKIKSIPELSIQRFDFNNKKYPFNNVHFRKALNYAFDKEKFIKERLKGRSIKAEGIFPPSSEVFNPDLKGYEFDLDKARTELKKSGVKLPVKIKITISESETNMKNAEFIKECLEKIGIECYLEVKPWKEFLEAIHLDRTETHLIGWVADTGDPDGIVYPLFHSSSLKSGANEMKYSNPLVDKLLEEARKMRIPDERKKIYQEIEKKVLEDAPCIFLYHPYERTLLSDKVLGIWPHPLGHFRLEIVFKFP